MKKMLAKIAMMTYFSTAMLFLISRSASAYIDPTTTTFIIQAVSGVAIAVGAFAVIWWRKAKKKVVETLNLKENQNKEVEEDIVEYTDEQK